MTNEEWIEEGVKRGFIIPIKGKYSLTGELHRNYVPLTSGLVVAKKTTELSQLQPVMNVDTLFMEFIKECQIPTKTANGRGGWYWINRFNKDGAKEFVRICSKENVNLQVLIASTKLYYLQTKECAKTISNYITEGIWRSGYTEMMNKVQEGTVQEYVKLETQSSPFGDDI